MLRSALAAPALWLPSREIVHPAEAWTHGATISPPAWAQAWGLDTNKFNISDFGAAGAIDTANTGNPGFLLYRKTQWPNIVTSSNPWGPWKTSVPTATGDYSISGGVLTINNDTAGLAECFNSACSASNGNGYNGTVFQGSAAFIFTMSFDPSLARSGFASWPLGWSMDLPFLTGATQHGIEPDFYEAFPTGTGVVQNTWAIHDWDTSISQNNQNTNIGGYSNLGSPTWTNLNEFGTLHIAAADNGGTGLIQRYFNGVHLNGGDITYTAGGPASPGATPSNPNGTFSIWDSQAVCFIIGCGPNWPASFGKMQVWQAS